MVASGKKYFVARQQNERDPLLHLHVKPEHLFTTACRSTILQREGIAVSMATMFMQTR